MNDLYFSGLDDLTYNELTLEVSDPLEQLIGQIRMLLYTNQGDVLGQINMGLNLERLIFETNYNKYTILNNIKYQIGQFLEYNTNNFTITYDLDFFRGTVRDMALLKIDINNNRVLDILIK